MTARLTANMVPTLLGVLGALLVWATLAGTKLPLIADERAAFYALLAIGVMMCMVGGISHTVSAQVGWGHPLNLAGYALGALAVLLALSVIAGLRLPLITDDRAALIALAGIGAGKWALAMVYYLFLK
jgi:hypothetical protein